MSDLLAVDGDRADQFVVLEHRDYGKRARASYVRNPDNSRIAFKVGGCVLMSSICTGRRLPR